MSHDLRDLFPQPEWLAERTIFLTVYGSKAYGLDTPESDTDLRGICIPPKEYFLGYDKSFEQAEKKGDPDCVVYGITKFFRLAAVGNPSIIEQLFVDDADIQHITYSGERIKMNRKLFLSKKIKHTFGGYAYSQLQRIKAHRRWLLNEHLMHQPSREEYGLPEHSLISADVRGAMAKLSEVKISFSDNVLELLKKENEYLAACGEWRNYKTWKETRNAKRAATERILGFDGKFASQLVRLLMMCKEILATGEVVVKRPPADRELLVGLKTAQTNWRYENLMAYVDATMLEIEALYETTKLPHAPDHVRLNRILVDIVEDYINK